MTPPISPSPVALPPPVEPFVTYWARTGYSKSVAHVFVKAGPTSDFHGSPCGLWMMRGGVPVAFDEPRFVSFCRRCMARHGGGEYYDEAVNEARRMAAATGGIHV